MYLTQVPSIPVIISILLLSIFFSILLKPKSVILTREVSPFLSIFSVSKILNKRKKAHYI